jgi:hypothetical protein
MNDTFDHEAHDILYGFELPQQIFDELNAAHAATAHAARQEGKIEAFEWAKDQSEFFDNGPIKTEVVDMDYTLGALDRLREPVESVAPQSGEAAYE